MAKSPAVDARLIRDRYEAGLKPIRSSLQEYWLNHAFLGGHQWVWYSPQTSRLDDLPRDPDRVQATINLMRPNTRIIISKSLQRELTFEVIPTAADDASLRGSKLGEAIIHSTGRDHDWESLRERLHSATWKGGVAAICIDWDPDGGPPVLPAETPEDQPVTGGDTVETVLSIADFVVEPGVRDAERARWWVKAQVLPPESVQAQFGLDKTPPGDATAGTTPFQRKMLSTHYAGGDSEQLADLTLVLTYYERPNPLRPGGAVAVLVDNKVVQNKPWPFPWKDRLNLAVCYETQDENVWTGSTVLSDARPVQVAYNASWSSIIEHMKQAGNARMFVPQSTIDLLEAMGDIPGEMVPYPDGTTPPKWESPPQMPAWWVDEPRALRDEMSDIMGVHDISRGDAPVNIESGYGLSVLAEQDTTPVGKLVKSGARAFGKIASMALKLFEAEVKGPRTAVVRTPSQPPETSTWTGRDLLRQTEAEVPLEAVMPRNKAAMMAQAEKLVTMGLIQSFEQYATIAELPGHKDLINRLDPDVAKARWENHMMALGRPCVPEAFDEHAKHITELNNFRKSAKYRQLDADTQAIYEEHAKAHEVMGAEDMGRARAKAAIDPALAAAPDANGGPVLPVGELPPGGGMAAGAPALPDEAGLPPMEGGMPINEDAAATGPGAPTMGTVVPPTA